MPELVGISKAARDRLYETELRERFPRKWVPKMIMQGRMKFRMSSVLKAADGAIEAELIPSGAVTAKETQPAESWE